MAKTRTTEPAETLYFLIQERRESGYGEYFHLNVSITTSRLDRGDRMPCGTRDNWSDPLKYAHLRITCQGDQQSRTSTSRQEPVYGFKVCYMDLYSVESHDVQRMARTLAKIDKGLEKLSEARGYARSFGDYVGRVAEVLKVSGMIDDRGKETANGTPYHWLSIGDGVNRIDNRIHQWQQSGLELAKGVAS